MEFRDLVELTKKSIVSPDVSVDDDDPLVDWDESVEPVSVAAGSQPSALPTTSRTATLSDPLTTGLLAEVARRTSTVEIDAETIEAARRACEIDPAEALEAARRTQEIDPEKLERVRRESQRTPTPEIQPNTRRRTTIK
jgi:hypothetical protein